MIFAYQLLPNPNQIKRSDGAIIPDITANYGDALLYQAWLADGGIPEPADPLPTLIRQIDKRRLKKALNQLGVLTTIETLISQLDVEAQIDWDDADIISENYPLVVALATNLGLDTDAIFTLANSLS
jgi:hypothetical protein